MSCSSAAHRTSRTSSSEHPIRRATASAQRAIRSLWSAVYVSPESMARARATTASTYACSSSAKAAARDRAAAPSSATAWSTRSSASSYPGASGRRATTRDPTRVSATTRGASARGPAASRTGPDATCWPWKALYAPVAAATLQPSPETSRRAAWGEAVTVAA